MSQYEDIVNIYLKKYRHAGVARIDINNTLRQFISLQPKLEPFTFNDGTEKELIQLAGTLPVFIIDRVYNIPLSIWVQDTHPYSPPMVFVKPNNTMRINPGQFVDASGKVDIPYLRDWNPNSDLITLAMILLFTFGEECPVFSVVPNQSQPQITAGWGSMSSIHQNFTQSGLNYLHPATSQGQSQPVRTLQTSTTYPSFQQHSSEIEFPASTFSTLGPRMVPQGNLTSATNNEARWPAPRRDRETMTSAQVNAHPLFTTVNRVGRNMRSLPGGTVTDAHLRASLVSAVEDKIRRHLKESYLRAKPEMDELCQTRQELMSGKQRLARIQADLKKEMTYLEKDIYALQQKFNLVTDKIQAIGNLRVSIDEAVETTAPLFKQLLQAFAEEQAIEDLVYYLAEALRKDVISLDLFMKNVRELSRRQFLLKATIQKCREKAGLPLNVE